MTDAELAAATVQVNQIELAARRIVSDGQDDGEVESARVVLRQTVSLRNVLEQWIVKRATRAPRASAQMTR